MGKFVPMHILIWLYKSLKKHKTENILNDFSFVHRKKRVPAKSGKLLR